MAGASADRERCLILNCDDPGLAHCVNEAAFEAWERGCLTSASVMAVGPRFDEVVRFGKIHRDLDLGVHLTLTSEWSRYQWGPLAGPGRVPSLVDADGFMWPDARAVLKHATLEDVELELTLQIQAVLSAGLTPTHLDSHMFVLLHRRLFPICGERFQAAIVDAGVTLTTWRGIPAAASAIAGARKCS